MAEHTPTPWTLDGPYVTNREPPAIGVSIADCGKSFHLDRPTQNANAAFIVEACNNHDRLTRENEAMRKALAAIVAEIPANQGGTQGAIRKHATAALASLMTAKS